MDLKRKQLLDRLLGRLFMLWLRPTVQILGFILRRDHTLELRDKMAVIKMMGGGSLIIAYPALLALRKRYPHVRFIFIGTPAVRPFAELLSLFDEIHDIVDDRGLWKLIASAVSTLIRCAKADTIIDLEIYSRLTTIFSALTLARNRIGFYLDVAFWREGITSHLFYFNRSTSMPLYYEQVARSLDAPALSMAEARTHFLAANRFSRQEQPHPGRHRLGLGVLCSEIAHERQLTPEQWAILLRRKFAIERLELNLFGSRSEMNQMRSVEQQLQQHLPGVTINNFCGQLSLHEFCWHPHRTGRILEYRYRPTPYRPFDRPARDIVLGTNQSQTGSFCAHPMFARLSSTIRSTALLAFTTRNSRHAAAIIFVCSSTRR